MWGKLKRVIKGLWRNSWVIEGLELYFYLDNNLLLDSFKKDLKPEYWEQYKYGDLDITELLLPEHFVEDTDINWKLYNRSIYLDWFFNNGLDYKVDSRLKPYRYGIKQE